MFFVPPNNVKRPWFIQGRKISRYHPILPALKKGGLV